MDWNALRAKIAQIHLESPHRGALADHALLQMQEAHTRLASLGHNFDLVEAPPTPPLEYPKMVYHVDQPPRTVYSSFELEELGEGWYDHPAKAKEMAGQDFQFAGRGGVSRNTKPLAPIIPAREVETSAQRAKRLEEEAKTRNLNDEELAALTQGRVDEMSKQLEKKE